MNEGNGFMECPRCNGQVITRRLDERTSKQECSECGFSRIVESVDGKPTDRRLLTDDSGTGDGKAGPLYG